MEVKGNLEGGNLGKIGIAYARASERLGRPPQSLDELKDSLNREFGDAAGLLVSANDGQPYEVICGVDIFRADPEGSGPAVVAYERTGVRGKRYVLLVGVAVRAMTDAEFARAHFPKGHQPPG